MEKKNILIVLTSSLDFNGITFATLDLVQQIDKTKFNCIVLSSFKTIDSAEKLFIDSNVNVIRLELRGKNLFRYYSSLRKTIRDYKIGVVHAMGSSAILAIEMLAGKKEKVSLRIAHSHNTYCKHRVVDKLLRPLFYKTYNYGIACGYEAGRWLFGRHNFLVLKNGKEFDKYKFNQRMRDAVRHSFGLSNDIQLIGHVGRFNEQKNHLFIVKIIEELRKIHSNFLFVFIGNGTKFNEIKEKLHKKELDKFVLFLGDRNDVNILLSAFDIMILPSLYEGLPSVAIEWQINGLPCLFSDNITAECKINDNVAFLPIADPLLWALEIVSCERKRVFDYNYIRNNLIKYGFDLAKNTFELERIYEKCE